MNTSTVQRRTPFLKTRIAFGVWALIWLFIATVGLQACLNIAAQNFPGYDWTEKLGFYVFFPGAVATCNVALVVFAKKVPVMVLLLAFFVQIPVLPLYIIFGSGGA